MSNPSFPFYADPSDPGIGKDQDPVLAAEQGHGTDSINVLGSEVGEASDEDVNNWIISSETVEKATENLNAEEESSDS